jgi:hypothetical protein
LNNLTILVYIHLFINYIIGKIMSFNEIFSDAAIGGFTGAIAGSVVSILYLSNQKSFLSHNAHGDSNNASHEIMAKGVAAFADLAVTAGTLLIGSVLGGTVGVIGGTAYGLYDHLYNDAEII